MSHFQAEVGSPPPPPAFTAPPAPKSSAPSPLMWIQLTHGAGQLAVELLPDYVGGGLFYFTSLLLTCTFKLKSADLQMRPS